MGGERCELRRMQVGGSGRLTPRPPPPRLQVWHMAPFNLTRNDGGSPLEVCAPAQLAWLATDLAAVNRTRTPWLVAVYHRPMYCSNADGDEWRVGGEEGGGRCGEAAPTPSPPLCLQHERAPELADEPAAPGARAGLPRRGRRRGVRGARALRRGEGNGGGGGERRQQLSPVAPAADHLPHPQRHSDRARLLVARRTRALGHWRRGLQRGLGPLPEPHRQRVLLHARLP